MPVSTDKSDSAQLEVLRLLDSSPQVTQRLLARELGMSLGKAHYCLHALVEKGFVKARGFRHSSKKRRYVYLLTPKGIAAKADLTRRFLEIKRREFDALRLEITRLERESATGQPDTTHESRV